MKRTALITGASAGIGQEFAFQLAERNYDLIITARREDRLQEVASQIRRLQPVSVEVVPGDLTDFEFVENLEEKILKLESLAILVNNAGFGISGEYTVQPILKHQRMIDVHVTATVRLTHAALPGMLRCRSGHIINVSSIAGFIPIKGSPGYCASKAYLNYFSTNLQFAIRGSGVKIQALCPGYTYTEFHSSSEYRGDERETLPKWVWMTASEVVSYSLKKMNRSKVVVIPGFKNRLITFFLRSSIAPSLMTLREIFMKK